MTLVRLLAGTVAVLAFVAINIGIVRGEHSLSTYFELRDSHARLSNRIESLQNERESLKAEIIRIKGSAKYARKILKDRYHVVEPDEDIIFFADP